MRSIIILIKSYYYSFHARTIVTNILQIYTGIIYFLLICRVGQLARKLLSQYSFDNAKNHPLLLIIAHEVFSYQLYSIIYHKCLPYIQYLVSSIQYLVSTIYYFYPYPYPSITFFFLDKTTTVSCVLFFVENRPFLSAITLFTANTILICGIFIYT